MGTLSGHGFHPLKARQLWSILPQDVHHQGRTPVGDAAMSAFDPKRTSAIRTPGFPSEPLIGKAGVHPFWLCVVTAAGSPAGSFQSAAYRHWKMRWRRCSRVTKLFSKRTEYDPQGDAWLSQNATRSGHQ